MRTVLLITGGVFALAAGVHVLRYLLMLINRTTLLPPFLAIGSLLLGLLMSLAAIVAAGALSVVLTSWLIGRRADAFARHGVEDPRPKWALWAGCLLPVVHWFFAPLYVVELADAEGCRPRLRRPVILWVIAWVITVLICVLATVTSLRAHDAQSVANNTVTTIIAYLAGLALVVLLWQVVAVFVKRPVTRPQHRWVVVAEQDAEPPLAADADDHVVEAAPDADEVSAIESGDREPAA